MGVVMVMVESVESVEGVLKERGRVYGSMSLYHIEDILHQSC
jgi:hypothetical protein